MGLNRRPLGESCCTVGNPALLSQDFRPTRLKLRLVVETRGRKEKARVQKEKDRDQKVARENSDQKAVRENLDQKEVLQK